jgi:F-type H+-transporting ATPase subunit c
MSVPVWAAEGGAGDPATEPGAEHQATGTVPPISGIWFSGAIGAAVTIVGAGYGISRIGSAAVESMARQPEVAGQIQTAMIIAAALIEGVTFFALIVCIMNGAPFPVIPG